jgi:ribosomal protein S18 acetylase RimI-like enzyme
MVIPATRRRTAHRNVEAGIRRLNPVHDLGQVADVIEEGFGQELTEPGRRALREMRLLSHFKPLLWWLTATSPDFVEYHSGFVWVQDGQIVGTLHVTRPRPFAERWFISNVAVRVGHRGRGIARRLMKAAMAWAQAQGGKVVFLRVRRDNRVAFGLYESLGFETLYDAVDLSLKRVPRVQTPPPDDAITLTPYHPRQWRQVRQLVRAAIPADLRWLVPIRIGDFRPGLTRRLGAWWSALFSGRRVERWVAQHEGKMAGAAVVRVARRRGSHSLAFHVHPAYRGRVEQKLVAGALSRLWPHRNRETVVSLPIGFPSLLEVLKRHGFAEGKVLTLMHRSLSDFNP